MTGLQRSVKIRISAHKVSSSKRSDMAITRTEGGDSHVTARFSFGAEHEVVAKSKVSFASSSAISALKLSSTAQSHV